MHQRTVSIFRHRSATTVALYSSQALAPPNYTPLAPPDKMEATRHTQTITAEAGLTQAAVAELPAEAAVAAEATEAEDPSPDKKRLRPTSTELASAILSCLGQLERAEIARMRIRKSIFEQFDMLSECVNSNSELLDAIYTAGAGDAYTVVAGASPPLVHTAFQALHQMEVLGTEIYGEADVPRWVDACILQSYWSAQHSKGRYKRRRTNLDLARDSSCGACAGLAMHLPADSQAAAVADGDKTPDPAEPERKHARATASRYPVDKGDNTPDPTAAEAEPEAIGDSTPQHTDEAKVEPASPTSPTSEEGLAERAAEGDQLEHMSCTSPTSEDGLAERAAKAEPMSPMTSPTSEEGLAERAAEAEPMSPIMTSPTSEEGLAEHAAEAEKRTREESAAVAALESALRGGPVNPFLQTKAAAKAAQEQKQAEAESQKRSAAKAAAEDKKPAASENKKRSAAKAAAEDKKPAAAESKKRSAAKAAAEDKKADAPENKKRSAANAAEDKKPAAAENDVASAAAEDKPVAAVAGADAAAAPTRRGLPPQLAAFNEFFKNFPGEAGQSFKDRRAAATAAWRALKEKPKPAAALGCSKCRRSAKGCMQCRG